MSQTVRFLLVLEGLGLLGAPLAARALPRLPGAGAGLGRVLALLLLGWGVWLAASLGVPNGAGLLVGVVLLLAGGALVAHRSRSAAPTNPFRRRLLIAGELLFVLAFLVGVWAVSGTPDVWGTEKPMDMAIVNATIVADHFPPHDPWLAGAQLNYYYLGQLMVGLLIRLTGVEPSQGYNLGLATVFALVVSTTFAVSATLAEAGRRQGLALPRPLLAGAVAVVLLALMGNLRGGWEALGRPDSLGSFDWFGASRVVPNTINEFPAFSFQVGDLHAHLLAVPLTLLALAFALQVAIAGRGRWWTTACAALTLGILYAVNSWSWPVMVGLFAATVLAWPRERTRTATWGAGVVALGIVLVLPFIVDFDPNAGGFGLVATATREPLSAFLRHHAVMEGALLWIVLVPLALQARRAPRAVAGAAALTAVVVLVLLDARLSGAALAAALALGALVVALQRGRPPAERFAWLLVSAGLVCLAGPEIAYVRDEFDGTQYVRMNTVFKLGYQAWLLLAVAGGLAVAAARAWLPRVWPRRAWLAVATGLMLVGLAYPVAAYEARRVDDRPRTLEGRAGMPFSTAGDLEAMDWLRAHAAGDAVLAEAVGDDYNQLGQGRMSTFTGRPAVLGWQGHELQWSHDVGTRRADVAALYRSGDPAQVRAIADRYGVDYVVVGAIELRTYGPPGAVTTLGRRVFARAGTAIYRV